jgi:AcrR family transcriptional regulator
VLDAAAATLLSGGLDALTLAGVAQAAGVHHTTVYRRWPTRSRLVLDTIIDLTQSRVPAPPSSGGVHRDLIAYFTPIVEGFRDPRVQTLVRSLIALPEAEIAEERREYWRARYEVGASIIDAAVARGELPAATDAGHIWDVIAGPIWMRMLITGTDVDAALLEQLVSEALARAVAAPNARSSE